jgi:serine/threonine-protein kinase
MSAPTSDDDAPLAPGTMVGEYRVERHIGDGTFGDVYAAVHPIIGKRVAIKVLRRRMSANAEVVARFVAEARAVNKARHPNIVDVFAFGTLAGDRHYHVMELLDGLTLGELLDREHRLPPARALPILQGIAAALDAAHAAGIVHRDLKPDNVFLVPDGAGGYTPKLLDFGVAKLFTDEMGVKTATGVAIGTPRYMPPEQARGRKIDHRADIYALGVLTHEVLTGDVPFHAPGPVDLLIHHATTPPPRMSSVCPDLPPELDGPVLAMLAKQAGERPASAGKAIAALAERIGATGAVHTRPLGTKAAEAEAATIRDAAPPHAAVVLGMATVRMGAPVAAPAIAPAPAPAFVPTPSTVLLDAPTLDARGARRAAPAAPPPPAAEVALAPTMVSGAPPSAPVSARDLPRSNLGVAVAAVGLLVVSLVVAAVFAFRGKAAAVAVSPPAVAVAPVSAAPSDAAPLLDPAPTVTPGTAAPAASEPAPASAPSAAVTGRSMPRAAPAPARTARDIGF